MGNEEPARAFYEAIEARDLERLESLVTPEFEMRSLIMESEGEVYRGPAGLARFVRDIGEIFPDFQNSIEYAEPGEDGALFRIQVTGHAAGSGIAVDQRLWALFRIRDGLLCDVRHFRTEAEARAAMFPAL